MSSVLAPVWFKFFLEAGIPPSDAGNYAVTFTENRIQPDMMTDLTKEYLAEMGITVLGDVIAILKHARVVHTQTTREKALQYTGLSLPNTDVLSMASRTAAEQHKNSVTKPVQAAVQHQKALSKKPVVTPTTKETISLAKQVTEKTIATTNHKNSIPSLHATPPVARKQLPSIASTDNHSNGSVIRLRTADEKSRTPQRGCSLTIVAPTGAVRSQSEAKRDSDLAKASVFNRLGREVASSDVTKVLPMANKTTFKVTLQSVDKDEVAQTKTNPVKSSSIFNRLGNKTASESHNSTSVGEGKVKPVIKRTASLSAATHPSTTKTILNLKQRLGPPTNSSAVTAASRGSEGILSSETVQNSGTVAAASARQRLGMKRPAANVPTDLPPAPKQAKQDVKARLGKQVPASVGSTKETRPIAISKSRLQVNGPKTTGVFGRLGSAI